MTYIAMCQATHRVDMSEMIETDQHILSPIVFDALVKNKP